MGSEVIRMEKAHREYKSYDKFVLIGIFLTVLLAIFSMLGMYVVFAALGSGWYITWGIIHFIICILLLLAIYDVRMPEEFFKFKFRIFRKPAFLFLFAAIVIIPTGNYGGFLFFFTGMLLIIKRMMEQ
jgi:hypothetical protein